MKLTRATLAALTLATGISLAPPSVTPANAAFCSDNPGRFNEWKATIKKEYKGSYKPSTLAKLDGVKYSNTVIKLDRNQKSFKMSFEQFYKRRATGVASGAKKRIRQYAKYFNRAEEKYGVPPEIIAAIWGLEFGFWHIQGQAVADPAVDRHAFL